MIIAYLLEGIIRRLTQRGLPRLPVVLIVFCLFMAFLVVALFGLLPMLSQQVVAAAKRLPEIIGWARTELMTLPQRYPEVISTEQVGEIMGALDVEARKITPHLLSLSVASLRGIMLFFIYLVLMPLMVFFFLKDKEPILKWLTSFMPEERALSMRVWRDVDRQIGNYIRGKFWEILVVWSVSSVTFHLLGLDFAMLIGLFVGLSVLVPYIGATVMTLPVALVGYYQWGWSPDFLYVMLAYLIIQALDGNLLAPLLLSGVVNLHPVAVILAVLVFGGLWGFWGVFFAIPLATLVQAVLRAWPRKQKPEPVTG